MLKRNKGGGEDRGVRARLQDTGFSINTGVKIIANVNSDRFLPKFSPLSLQQAFTLPQDKVQFSRFIMYTYTVSTIPKGKTCTCVSL